jgi:hypothetical protein
VSSYQWNDAPPTTLQRVVAGVYVAILLAALANDHFEWRLVGLWKAIFRNLDISRSDHARAVYAGCAPRGVTLPPKYHRSAMNLRRIANAE